MAFTSKLGDGQRAERKLLITVAELADDTTKRQVLGARVEDSSIELNADVATSTDILGKTYTDVNKTEPQQSFDPSYIMGDNWLTDYLTQAALENNKNAYNGTFNIYTIAAWLENSAGSYYATKQTGCSIIPQSLGGDSFVGLPFDVYFSNDITVGSVDKLGDDFIFTPETFAAN